MRILRSIELDESLDIGKWSTTVDADDDGDVVVVVVVLKSLVEVV